MAEQQVAPTVGKAFATGVLVLLAAAWYAAPVLASASSPKMCKDAPSSAFEIPATALDAMKIGADRQSDGIDSSQPRNDGNELSASRYLPASAGARLRRDLKEKTVRDSDDPVTETHATDGEKQSTVKTRVPGVSDVDLARFKRQMYRRDI
jgi:hypothetical protein